MSNDFLLPVEQYVQNINPLGQYIDQASAYLSIQKGCTKEFAKEYITKLMKSKTIKTLVDPEVTYFERDSSFIKEKKTIGLSGYIRSAIDNNEVIVPTLTTYVSEKEKISLVSVFMKRNATRRGVLKKQSQKEELAGNLELAYNLNNDQDNAKRNNNSMSGVMAAMGSIFENPTGHNTLTSMTRSMSSISNALNERMISGNRHYFMPELVINNLTAIIQTMDTQAVKDAVRKYGLVIPTPKDVSEMVAFSTDQYRRDRHQTQTVLEYAQKMTPEQRCAVVYTQDLYHMRKLNPGFIRDFIDNFSGDITNHAIDDPVAVLNSCDPLITNYAHQVHVSMLKGKGKTYDEWDPDMAYKVANTCRCIEDAVLKYKSLIQAFLIVRTVPSSSGYISHMNRRTVVLSDTDSTMFSIDEWVNWYFGELVFTDKAFAVAGAVMFVSTQLVAHAMALFSANMNVARDKLFVLSMKPEFVFPVFAQTPVAKHYFCSVSIKEGGVYSKNKFEIKGVHLKNSASPLAIVEAAQDRMMYLLSLVESGEKISMTEELQLVADLERKITTSLLRGESEYYKKLYIKEATSYGQGPELSMYRFHTMWNEVFAYKYGEIEAPPYIVIKIPLTTTTKSKMKDWMDSIADRAIAKRLEDHFIKTGRTVVKTLYLSKDFIDGYGIPVELTGIIDVKKVVLDLTVINRIVLSSIGYFCKTDTMLTESGY